tara:strand:+ start:3427 stop:3876 length:450 start_codon:yes stop_codon:yes gene_type:complete
MKITVTRVKDLLVCTLVITIIACTQNHKTMDIPDNASESLTAFIQKKKFVREKFYPGIAKEELRPVVTKKINSAALDFMAVIQTKTPTNELYQEAIEKGLARFSDIYLVLDTEDRERICGYFEEMMDIVGLESSNGQLNNFMYGFEPNQ